MAAELVLKMECLQGDRAGVEKDSEGTGPKAQRLHVEEKVPSVQSVVGKQGEEVGEALGHRS